MTLLAVPVVQRLVVGIDERTAPLEVPQVPLVWVVGVGVVGVVGVAGGV